MASQVFHEDSTVIDSSCLIHLWKLELIRSLTLQYSRIYIPRYVQEEVGRKGRIKRKLKELIYNFDPFLQTCDLGNQFDAQFLYDRQLNPGAAIDRGESEVIVQARERRISNVLIDDRRAKKVAETHTLKVYDLLDILGILKRNNIIHAVKPYLAKLGKKYKPSASRLKEFLIEHNELTES